MYIFNVKRKKEIIKWAFWGKILLGLVPGGKQILAAGEQEDIAVKALEKAIKALRDTQMDDVCTAALTAYDNAEKEMDSIDGDIPSEVAERHDFAIIGLIKAVASSDAVSASIKELFETVREAKKQSLHASYEALKLTSPSDEDLASAKEHFDKELAALED